MIPDLYCKLAMNVVVHREHSVNKPMCVTVDGREIVEAFFYIITRIDCDAERRHKCNKLTK
jgi:hypothetical protein